MKHAVLLAVLLLPLVAHADDYGAYHALVIGNDAYQSFPKLETAVADAQAVAEELKAGYSYQVTLLENAT